jgi:hypothetical protein
MNDESKKPPVSDTHLKRAAKSVSLVLISSSLILAGCRRTEDTARDTRRSGSGGYHGGRFVYIGTGVGGARTGTAGGRPGVGTTSRGGFGASGHAAASS